MLQGRLSGLTLSRRFMPESTPAGISTSTSRSPEDGDRHATFFLQPLTCDRITPRLRPKRQLCASRLRPRAPRLRPAVAAPKQAAALCIQAAAPSTRAAAYRLEKVETHLRLHVLPPRGSSGAALPPPRVAEHLVAEGSRREAAGVRRDTGAESPCVAVAGTGARADGAEERRS